jgi:hypothetical protein
VKGQVGAWPFFFVRAKDNSVVPSTEVSFDTVRRIAEAAAVAGGRALVVGGWVRDRLREHPSKDIDIEVFGISQEQLPELLTTIGRVEPRRPEFSCLQGRAAGMDRGRDRRRASAARVEARSWAQGFRRLRRSRR